MEIGIRRVCLITNYNLYESKRHFTQKLAEAFNRQKIETIIIDVEENILGIANIEPISRFYPDFTCSFNSLLPISQEKDKRFLWDFLKIPHLALLVDPALYSINYINSPYSILSCVDRSDCEILHSNGYENVFFLPHAIEKELVDQRKDLNKPLDVVFIGSCYDYETLRVLWRNELSEECNRILDNAIEIFFGDDQISLAEALVKARNETQIEVSGADFLTLFYYLDYYTRGKDRMDLIHSIKDAQIHIYGGQSPDIVGSLLGWPEYLSNQSNVTIHSPIAFPESFDVLKNSKICLNSMPFFKDGSHERIFTGFACGALPVTTNNIYISENFKDDEEIIFYQHSRLDFLNDKINSLLSDEKRRQEMVNRGQEKIIRNHTWDNRVDEMVRLIPKMIGKIIAQTSFLS